MKQQHLKILRYNTGTDKKAFVQFKGFFDAAIFNATIVAYSGSSVADLISMHSRRYIIDPQTHIFQQDVSAYTTESKKTHMLSIKKSVAKYLDQMPPNLAEKILKSNQKPEPTLIAQNLDPLVECVYKFQTEYINTFIQKKDYDKYLKFVNMGPRPKLVIAPYFMIKSGETYSETEMWMQYNRICLEKTIAYNRNENEEEIAAQLVLEKNALSEAFIELVATTYDVEDFEYIFIWIDDFNSFEAQPVYNELFFKLICTLNQLGKKPIMAYGGYESIVLCNQSSPARLYGVAQSVGYGEYRAITPVGGGMPVNKYYFLPTHYRMRFDDAARILVDHGYFSADKTEKEHAQDYFRNICDCGVCHEIVGEDINGFSAYNDSIAYTVKTRNGPLSKNRPTTDAALIAALHFLNCKVFEWEYVETTEFSAVLDNLKDCYAQYQPKFSGRIDKWCEIYGKQTN